MKTIKSILFAIAILFSFTVSAQYGGYGGMNGGYGGMNRGYGSGYGTSRMGMQNGSGFPNAGTHTVTEKEKEEKIDKIVEKLKTDLELDELQVFAIKNEVVNNSKAMEKIMADKEEKSQEEKEKEALALNEKTDRNILGFLSKEQKEKYKKFIEDRKTRIEEFKAKNRQ